LLEGRKDLYSHNGLFDRLARGFKGFFAAKIRQLLAQHARQLKTELRYRKVSLIYVYNIHLTTKKRKMQFIEMLDSLAEFKEIL